MWYRSILYAALLGAVWPMAHAAAKEKPPSDLVYSENPAVFDTGVQITPDVPSSSGGAVTSYRVRPELPDGLALNASTGQITGTPTAITPRKDYTVTAANSGGRTRATLTLTVTALRTVQGTHNITYLPFDPATATLTPSSPVPTVTSASTMKALLAGGTTVLPGVYDQATGAYTIPDVPLGYFWLKWGSNYLWTNLSSVSLDWLDEGRQDVTAARTDTYVVWNVTGMDPWNSGSSLTFFEYNSSNYFNPYGPNPGDTALDNMTMDWIGSNLVDTTQGDEPMLQVVEDSLIPGTTSEHAVAVTQIVSPAPVVMADGVPCNINGNFSNVPQTDTVYVNYSRSEFCAYRSEYNPNGVQSPTCFRSRSTPGFATYGDFSTWFNDNLNIYNADVTVTADLNLGAFPAPVLPKGFERLGMTEDNYYMHYSMPGATSPYSQEVEAMRRYSLKNADATHPIKPLLSPVKNPTINGLSLFSDQAGVGLTPTLAWAAPDLGKPTGCIVYIYQLGISGGSTTSNRVGRLFLDGKLTSVTLPAGILASGNEYYFVIRVVFDPSWNPLAEPLYANMAPFQRSETASNLVTP